jgi:Flp pilus assembly protein TadG
MRIMRAFGRRWVTDESGEQMISFALSMPILMGVLFGLMEICLGCYNYQRISELAREGTRYGMVRGATCKLSSGASCTAATTDIQTYVNSIALPNLGGGTTTVTASFPSGNESVGSTVKVIVTYSYPYKIPFMATNAISLTSTSVEPILQ